MKTMGAIEDPFGCDRNSYAVVGSFPEHIAHQIDAKIVSHGRYVAFQMAEVAIPRNLFAEIL